ncbi:lipopolysaccharide biosynthesis protein [Bradyrhizobium sp. ARR65]|uniref:lipopolysaccharide biosynthesis protein n=1 Tax=Bradyrhizobium sp. ARR65 TaxID=1040989 RepID=UPI000467B2CC|nr:lipopolysaccharide biosynthesis protein [Bradyrhizobium sp. ARR65]
MLTTKTILGAGWTVSSRLAGRLIDFVTVLVLARMLSPADFGLTALAMTLTTIVDMVLEVPLIQALTRLPEVRKSHIDTAFTLGVLRGLFLLFVVLAAAWPFSYIYHDNRLIPLVATTAIGPLMRSFYSPAMVKYVREMSFRQIFIAEFVGKIIAATIAISVLYLGGGYWAIVANGVSASVAATLISYILAPYRPRITLADFSDFSGFLGWFSTAQIVIAFSWQFDRILLGYFVNRSDLGHYTMATDLAVLPTQSLIGPAMQPVMAAFSRIHNDRKRLQNAYSKASQLTMLVAVPICIGMSLTSDLLVNVLLGAKWKEVDVFLQWLALATMLSAFYPPVHALALATNRTNVVFRLSLTEFLLRIVLIPLGLHFYSLMGAIFARLLISLIMFVLVFATARQLTGFNTATEAFKLGKIAAAGVIMALLVLVVRHEMAAQHVGMLIELVVTVCVGAAVYFGALYALGVRLMTNWRLAIG